jgi:iron(III) transport system substrate-binding protein
VYSPHGKEMLAEFERLFEERHPDVDVRWLDMGSQDAYDRIRTERQNPQADIWWGAPSSVFENAAREGLLDRYIPSWDSAMPPAFKSREGLWFGTFITPEVIMYNNRVLTPEEAPQDWDDILDPQWRGKVIIRYPLASGTMRVIFSALIQREFERTGDPEAGFEWLRTLDANTKTYAADPTQLYLRIAREEGLVSLWNLPDVIIQVGQNNYPFGYIIPESGTPLIADCIAIVKGTKNRAAAEAFYEFVTSYESLVLQAREFHRIPARKDIATADLPDWITSLSIRPMEVDWQRVEANEKEWMKRWDEEVKGRGR